MLDLIDRHGKYEGIAIRPAYSSYREGKSKALEMKSLEKQKSLPDRPKEIREGTRITAWQMDLSPLPLGERVRVRGSI
jgi:hypothetical protein